MWLRKKRWVVYVMIVYCFTNVGAILVTHSLSTEKIMTNLTAPTHTSSFMQKSLLIHQTVLLSTNQSSVISTRRKTNTLTFSDINTFGKSSKTILIESRFSSANSNVVTSQYSLKSTPTSVFPPFATLSSLHGSLSSSYIAQPFSTSVKKYFKSRLSSNIMSSSFISILPSVNKESSVSLTTTAVIKNSTSITQSKYSKALRYSTAITKSTSPTTLLKSSSFQKISSTSNLMTLSVQLSTTPLINSDISTQILVNKSTLVYSPASSLNSSFKLQSKMSLKQSTQSSIVTTQNFLPSKLSLTSPVVTMTLSVFKSTNARPFNITSFKGQATSILSSFKEMNSTINENIYTSSVIQRISSFQSLKIQKSQSFSPSKSIIFTESMVLTSISTSFIKESSNNIHPSLITVSTTETIPLKLTTIFSTGSSVSNSLANSVTINPSTVLSTIQMGSSSAFSMTVMPPASKRNSGFSLTEKIGIAIAIIIIVLLFILFVCYCRKRIKNRILLSKRYQLYNDVHIPGFSDMGGVVHLADLNNGFLDYQDIDALDRGENPLYEMENSSGKSDRGEDNHALIEFD